MPDRTAVAADAFNSVRREHLIFFFSLLLLVG